MTQVEGIRVNCNLYGVDHAHVLVQDKVWRQGDRYIFSIVQHWHCGPIYTQVIGAMASLGGLLWTSAMGVLARPAR
jgi:hypothetical protein